MLGTEYYRERGRTGGTYNGPIMGHWEREAYELGVRESQQSTPDYFDPNAKPIPNVLGVLLNKIFSAVFWFFKSSGPLTIASKKLINFVLFFYIAKFFVYIGTYFYWSATSHSFAYMNVMDNWIREILAAIIAVFFAYFIVKPKAVPNADGSKSALITIVKVLGMMCLMGFVFYLLSQVSYRIFNTLVGFSVHRWLRFII